MFHNLFVRDGNTPTALTFPYHYEPHPWVEKAALCVRTHLENNAQGQPGRLIAVLVVQNDNGDYGFYAGCDQFDSEDAFFVKSFWQQLPPAHFPTLKTDYLEAALDRRSKAEEAFVAFRTAARDRKSKRRLARMSPNADLAALASESQKDSRELDRLKGLLTNAIYEEERMHARIQTETQNALMADWRQRLSTIELTNACQEKVSLFHLLEGYLEKEEWLKALLRSSLPALLKTASEKNEKLIAFGSFWWGTLPSHDARQEGVFYSFSKERHAPLLDFQLKGLTLEANRLAIDHFAHWQPEIIYEDDDLVAVNKPAGLLSVPGKHAVRNVYDTVLSLYPNATGPMLLHRLDMATSGVLLFAKTKLAHQQLQYAFAHGHIQKRYVALLEKRPADDFGEINLPLCLNPLERPRQMVSRAYGKYASTQYEVLEQQGQYTCVAFYPKTGRTHQLRLHAAHHRGLNSPIVGDELYGHPADRLYLHAQSLTFTHPRTQEVVTVVAKTPF